jgi:hypothetical protein
VILYHGTDRRLRRFRHVYGTQPNTIGIWLTDSMVVAEKFARRATRSPRAECGVVIAEVRITRPLVFATYADFIEAWAAHGHDAAALRKTLIGRKYDAILVEKSDTDFEHTRRDFAVFNPRNIRVTSFVPCAQR